MAQTPISSAFKYVMLIDDNDIDNFINERIIKGFLFAENVYIHSGSQSALEFLNNLQKLETPPDDLLPSIIFLDINMPVMDGFYFLDEFSKLSEVIKDSVKIVMLTTSTNMSDIERTKPYKEVIKFLHKPLTEINLAELKKMFGKQ